MVNIGYLFGKWYIYFVGNGYYFESGVGELVCVGYGSGF